MGFHDGSVSEYEYLKSKGRSECAGSSGLILPVVALGFEGRGDGDDDGDGVEGARGGLLGIRVNGGSSSVSEWGEEERRRRPARAWAPWVGRRHGRSLRGRNIFFC
jgi:hypothetical protein